MKWMVLAIALSCAAPLIACADEDGSAVLTDEDRAFVEQVVALQRAGDWDGLEALVGFTEQPCHPDAPDDPSPPCRDGEAEGTPVDAFFHGFCHSAFVRPAPDERLIRENAGITTRGADFYGVLRGRTATWLGADYEVVFVYEDTSGRGVVDGYWYTVREHRIVAESRSCGSLAGSIGSDPEFLLEADDAD